MNRMIGSKQKDNDVCYMPKQDYLQDHGKIRKLSVTISLNNPDEYDGNLEFDYRNQIDCERNKKKFCHKNLYRN